MMRKVTRAKLNWCEFVSLRLGLSIYSGWLTTALILNITYTLKCFGFKDPALGSFDEECWTILILWVAFFIYNVVTYVEDNAAYGCVFIWVIFAIMKNLNENRPELEGLLVNVVVIALYYCLSMLWKLTKFLGVIYVRYRKYAMDKLSQALDS